MSGLTVSVRCQGCDAQPPDGADPDRWADRHAKTPGHAVVTATVLARTR